MITTSTELKVLGSFSILGDDYQVGRDDEGFYTLLDEDGDEVSEPMELDYDGEDTEEIICELYLCHYDSYKYKHPDVTSSQWIATFENVYNKGRYAGRKEQMALLIDDMEKDLENM